MHIVIGLTREQASALAKIIRKLCEAYAETEPESQSSAGDEPAGELFTGADLDCLEPVLAQLEAKAEPGAQRRRT